MSRKSPVAAFLFFSAVLVIYPQTFSLRAGGGIMFPQQNSFRNVYGNAYPLVVEAGVRLTEKFGLSSGVHWISKNGRAWPLDQGQDEFPVHFEMISVPVSVFYEFAGRLGGVPLGIILGLGISWHSYRETWETVDLRYQDSKLGPLVYAAADFHFFSWAGFFTSLRWESVPTGWESHLGGTVNLGGFQLLAGVAFYLN